MAFILALSQVLADIPEGFAVIANFRDKGVGRAQRLVLSASFVVPVVGVAVLAYFTLRGQSEDDWVGLCGRAVYAGCRGGHVERGA